MLKIRFDAGFRFTLPELFFKPGVIIAKFCLMTLRQKILSMIYPLLSKLSGKQAMILMNVTAVKPLQPFHGLNITLNNNQQATLEEWRGKKVLVVNTASDCGYTAQYKELQLLYDQYQNKLVIIAFPSNDFKEQEKRDDAAILEFCQVNYGVRFPLAKKSIVVKGAEQHPVFQWLTHKEKNGWNDQEPKWNFSKFLVNEEGVLTHYFDPAISPLSKEVIQAISK